MLFQCCPTVFDAGPTLKQHWVCWEFHFQKVWVDIGLVVPAQPLHTSCLSLNGELLVTNVLTAVPILGIHRDVQPVLMTTLLCKDKRQYLLTCKVSRYGILPFRGTLHRTVYLIRMTHHRGVHMKLV